ncbi:MAG: type II toxin-antitoxin system RelB/DinJ family antitoxin [Candidatus Paceibacterota bacterium]
MTTLNIRIEDGIKERANKTLSGMGLDMSTAVKIFLNQVIEEKGMPFIPTKNPALIRAKWDKELEAAKKSRGYKTADDMFRALDK